jgi:uncharacterized Zn-finger protein
MQIEHQCTSEIVCPYCGYTLSDSWELTNNDGKLECENCGKNYVYSRNVEVEYTTTKTERQNKW